MSYNWSYYISFLKKIGLAFVVYSICRIIFYLFNHNHFIGDFPFETFFYGIRFDYVAISYFFLPFIFLSILPIPYKTTRYYKLGVKISFHIANTLSILLNFIDVGYFPFSNRRSTADLFQFLSTGDDFGKMLPTYLKDYWILLILLVLLVLLTEFFYRKSDNFIPKDNFTFKTFSIQFITFIFTAFFTIIGFRGGFQLKPIDIINGANHTSPQRVPLILNTPFSIIKTILNPHIKKLDFFHEDDLAKIYTPEQLIEGVGNYKSKNVVIVILESFAKEYVGFLNNGKGYTPFLDSLMAKSYVFTNAYSSGTRSIESLPSILSGIPPLINTPYIYSNYSSNKIDALPAILKKHGYNTSFYHGGTNGTMGFSGFTASAGIDGYFGKDEYPLINEEEESSWGIFDEPYLNYFSKELSEKKEPFFSVVFTLSSHHPYQLPEKYIGKFPEGDLPIHKTVGYTDYALKQFFEKSRNASWFKNSLFVFTADHSILSSIPLYSTIVGRYAIPIFIYDPSNQLKGVNSNFFQHTDITPTILDLLGIKTKIISFGNSIFSSNQKHIIGLISNSYFYAEKDYVLIFDGSSSKKLYHTKQDSLMQNNLLEVDSLQTTKNNLEKKVKAILQQYNNRLIDNKTKSEN